MGEFNSRHYFYAFSFFSVFTIYELLTIAYNMFTSTLPAPLPSSPPSLFLISTPPHNLLIGANMAVPFSSFQTFRAALLFAAVTVIACQSGSASAFLTTFGVANNRRSDAAPTALAFTSRATTENTSTESAASIGAPVCSYFQVTIPTSQTGPPRQAISVEDLTPHLNCLLASSSMRSGVVNVISRHTTTAITINERESRLAEDMAKYLIGLAPPDERSEAATAREGTRYRHNDIDKRPDSAEEAQRCRENGWDIDNPEKLQKWRDQEPINAHSHLLSMLLGSSESIPVVDGEMVIGQWQSVLLVDLDGPRERTVGVQLMGYQ